MSRQVAALAASGYGVDSMIGFAEMTYRAGDLLFGEYVVLRND
jgi:hypothetical protein